MDVEAVMLVMEEDLLTRLLLGTTLVKLYMRVMNLVLVLLVTTIAACPIGIGYSSKAIFPQCNVILSARCMAAGFCRTICKCCMHGSRSEISGAMYLLKTLLIYFYFAMPLCMLSS